MTESDSPITKKFQFIAAHMIYAYAQHIETPEQLLTELNLIEDLVKKDGNLLFDLPPCHDGPNADPKEETEENVLHGTTALAGLGIKLAEKEEEKKNKPTKAEKKAEDDHTVECILKAWNEQAEPYGAAVSKVIVGATSPARRKAILSFAKTYNIAQGVAIFKEAARTGNFAKDNGDIWKPNFEWALGKADKLFEQSENRKVSDPTPKDLVAGFDKAQEEGAAAGVVLKMGKEEEAMRDENETPMSDR